MSVQATCKTLINDEASLIDAIEELYGKNSVVVNREGQNVEGYTSSKKPTVLVRVAGMFGTAGFYKGSDGNYELVYDRYDVNAIEKLIPQKKKGKVVHVLAQTYAKQKIMKAMKDLRARIISDQTDETGAVKMRLRVTQY